MLSTSSSPTLAQQLCVALLQTPPLAQREPCYHQSFFDRVVPPAVMSMGHSSNQGNLKDRGRVKEDCNVMTVPAYHLV